MSCVVLFAVVWLLVCGGSADNSLENECQGEMGCLQLTSEWYHPRLRPINKVPKPRHEINIKYVLFTRDVHDEYKLEMTEESILASPFNSSKPSFFIIHGYLDNRKFGPWMDELRHSLLNHYDTNVIILEWGDEYRFIRYEQAVADSRMVGVDLGMMLQNLNNVTGMSFKDVHLIGHSLGAHIAGYASKWRGNKVGRITGLDPSQPEFRGMPPRVRLDRGDAYFVDIIHTSTTNLRLLNFGYGIREPIGHADFYPNGGTNQPGCSVGSALDHAISGGIMAGGRQLFSCSHQRAHVYFIESLDHERCTPTAITCPSYADYQAGRCGNCGPDGSRCAIMGMRAIESKAFMRENSSNVYYLNMDSTSTHCREHYRVTLHYGSKMEPTEVTVKMSLSSGVGSTRLQTIRKGKMVWPDSQGRGLLSSYRHLDGPLTSLSLRWQYHGWFQNLFTSGPLDITKVDVQHISGGQAIQSFCPSNSLVSDNIATTLYPC